jgi:hemerythrin-like domain-containing protein
MAKPRKRTTAKRSQSTKTRARAAKSGGARKRRASKRSTSRSGTSRPRSATRRSKSNASRSAGSSARTRSRTAARRGSRQDAIALLKADHVRIKSVLGQMQKATTEARRSALVDQAEQLLTQHTMIEEQVFYPAFREAAKSERDRRLFHEATEEHHTVDLVLPEVRAARHEPDVYAARAKVLRELVMHHVEEEQEQMFPRARQLFSEPELRQLGEEMQARKREPSGALEKVGALIGLNS